MLLKIFKKEMKDCFRDRRTLLLTVFLPMLMMTCLIFFYEKLSSNEDDTLLQLAVNSSISSEEERIFSVYDNVEILKSSDPKEMVQEGKAQAALILTANFVDSIKKGEEASITIFGDTFSKNSSNLIYLVTNALDVYEKEVVADRLQTNGTDPKIIQPFTIVQEEISEEDGSTGLLAMLIPLILAIAIGVGAGPAASDLFSGEKEKKTMEALLMSPVNRSTLLVAKWLTIASIGTIIGLITLLVLVIEINLFTENLKSAMSFGDETISVISFSIFITVMYAMFTATLLMITSIIGKTVKESQSYSSPIMMLCVLPSMILASVGINELAFQHFAIPILNIFSIFKELLFGMVDYEHIFITIVSNVICIIVGFIVGRVLFLKDKWVMN